MTSSWGQMPGDVNPYCWCLYVTGLVIVTMIPARCWLTTTRQKLSLLWRHNGGRMRIKSPASRLFTQLFIQTQIKENIKAPRHWPLCGEFTGDRWIPRTNGQLRGKCFHLMTSWCTMIPARWWLTTTRQKLCTVYMVYGINRNYQEIITTSDIIPDIELKNKIRPTPAVGVTKPIPLVSLFSDFSLLSKHWWPIKTTFIFDRCHRSSAAVNQIWKWLKEPKVILQKWIFH